MKEYFLVNSLVNTEKLNKILTSTKTDKQKQINKLVADSLESEAIFLDAKERYLAQGDHNDVPYHEFTVICRINASGQLVGYRLQKTLDNRNPDDNAKEARHMFTLYHGEKNSYPAVAKWYLQSPSKGTTVEPPMDIDNYHLLKITKSFISKAPSEKNRITNLHSLLLSSYNMYERFFKEANELCTRYLDDVENTEKKLPNNNGWQKFISFFGSVSKFLTSGSSAQEPEEDKREKYLTLFKKVFEVFKIVKDAADAKDVGDARKILTDGYGKLKLDDLDDDLKISHSM